MMQEHSSSGDFRAVQPRSTINTARCAGPTRLLLIDDDQQDYAIMRDLVDEITNPVCTLEWASSFELGLERLTTGQHGVCFVDFRLGARDGIELMRMAGEMGAPGPVVVLTGQDDREIEQRAADAGAADYLVKWNLDRRGTLSPDPLSGADLGAGASRVAVPVPVPVCVPVPEALGE